MVDENYGVDALRPYIAVLRGLLDAFEAYHKQAQQDARDGHQNRTFPEDCTDYLDSMSCLIGIEYQQAIQAQARIDKELGDGGVREKGNA